MFKISFIKKNKTVPITRDNLLYIYFFIKIFWTKKEKTMSNFHQNNKAKNINKSISSNFSSRQYA